jgi:predicted esterase
MKTIKEKRERLKVLGLALFFIMAFFHLLALPAQQSENLKIYQTDKRILIDGNLDDWKGIEERPVNLSINGEQIQPSSDLSVTAMFTYDPKNFYAAVKVLDDLFEFPNRSWRYGDGFLLTFLDPAQGNESDRFVSFGISLEEEETVGLVVNKDGIYFPGTDIRDMKLKIVPDEKKGEIMYEMAIPFKYLVPFKPFIQERWGINLVYADRDQGERTLVFLYPDPGYDTELSDKRKGAVFQFIHHVREEPEIQMSLGATHFYHDDEISLILAILSPEEMSGWQIKSILLGPSARNVPQTDEFSLKEGMNVLRFNLEERDYGTGAYDLSVGVINDQGTLRFKEDTRFFVLNRSEFEQFQTKFDEVKKSELYTKDEKFRKSLSNLEIRFDWIKEYMDEAPPFIGIDPIEEWYDEIETLYKNIDEGKPALFPPGSIGRYAHRSEIDGTLQPYTVYIPQDYNEEYPTPLFVTLHGSGVNEVQYAYSMAMVLGAGRFRGGIPKMIMIAPQARGLSDWYTGNSGKDVIECIDHIKALYNIDEENMILDGFSMGGYGAWRLSLLHPDFFKAVIIRSGAIFPPPYIKGENILDLLDKGKELDFFIVHGAKDNAVPVENARRAVQKLKELGISHKYVEVKDAYHTDYDKWGEIFGWLRSIIKQNSEKKEK